MKRKVILLESTIRTVGDLRIALAAFANSHRIGCPDYQFDSDSMKLEGVAVGTVQDPFGTILLSAPVDMEHIAKVYGIHDDITFENSPGPSAIEQQRIIDEAIKQDDDTEVRQGIDFGLGHPGPPGTVGDSSAAGTSLSDSNLNAPDGKPGSEGSIHIDLENPQT